MFSFNLRRSRIFFLLCAVALLSSACGGENKNGSAEDASTDAEDAVVAAPPGWMADHKDDIIFWARPHPDMGKEMSGYFEGFSNVFLENGTHFMFVTGNCEYWVYRSFGGEGNDIQQRWSDIYTGVLSNDDCIQFQKDLRLGQNRYNCVNYDCTYTGVMDVGGTFLLGDADGALSCGCDCSMDEAKDVYQNQQNWFEHMLKNGVPYDGKLRGMLISAKDEFSSKWVDMPAGLEKSAATRELWENIPDFFPENVPEEWLPSPEWKPSTSTPAIRGMTIIFPDEYQEQLKELRQRQRNLEFGTRVYGIPLIDSAGNKYALFLRPSIPLEDEHGLIDPPERCEPWLIVESTMEYPY